MDSAPFRPVPDTSGRISKFFPFRKKTLFQWYTFGQNPHTTDNLRGFLSKFDISSSPFASIMASIIFGIRSIGFWVSPIGLVFQTWLSAFFHMCMVRLWHAFTSLYIFLCKFKSTWKFSFYGHAIMTSRGNHFLHGLTVLIKSKIMKQKDFTQGVFPPPGYIAPCSFMNTTIALHFRTYLFVMWKCCILLM